MPESTGPEMVVVFTLAGESYALPITKVQEIVRYIPPREVASTERGNRGVISVRGKITPVYDLAARLGGRAQIDDDTRIIIVASARTTAGVIVDRVDEVLTISPEQIENASGADSLVDSIVRVGDHLIALIDTESLLRPGDLAA
jgi:purine-binding chemotaxis protein CheW